MERIFKYLDKGLGAWKKSLGHRHLPMVLVCLSLFLLAMGAAAQVPTISPTATFINENEEEQTIVPGENYIGAAPLAVTFKANPADVSGWSEYYEWRFYTEKDMENPYMIRYEEDTEFTFVSAGAHRIVCYAIFKNGTEEIDYTQEYWTTDERPISISITESRLEMPNAFSPNGDDYNDIYKAKKGYQSIVEFHAYIFNRWGVKLYEWHDPAGGWDGKYKGKDVPEGTYFVLVKAKGADGRIFNIKRDVNLLRGYTEGNTTVVQ